MPDLNDIPGWFEPTDVALFRWFLQQQQRLDAPGDLAELGVFMGKSAVLIGQHVSVGETFTVVDLFEAEAGSPTNSVENSETYRNLTRGLFETTYQKFLPELPQIVQGESATIVEHASHGTHRFVHVDASHLYRYVAQDVLAAKILLRPDGIAVFDDIRSVHTPGVWAAVWEAVAKLELRPLAVTSRKFYGTWGSHAAWHERLRDLPSPFCIEVQEIMGFPVLRTWLSPSTQPRHRRYAKALLPPLLARRTAALVASTKRARASLPRD